MSAKDIARILFKMDREEQETARQRAKAAEVRRQYLENLELRAARKERRQASSLSSIETAAEPNALEANTGYVRGVVDHDDDFIVPRDGDVVRIVTTPEPPAVPSALLATEVSSNATGLPAASTGDAVSTLSEDGQKNDHDGNALSTGSTESLVNTHALEAELAQSRQHAIDLQLQIDSLERQIAEKDSLNTDEHELQRRVKQLENQLQGLKWWEGAKYLNRRELTACQLLYGDQMLINDVATSLKIPLPMLNSVLRSAHLKRSESAHGTRYFVQETED